MAHLHFQRTVYKSGGREASQRIAYITRQPQQEFAAAAEQLLYISRADREDLICTKSHNLPGWAAGNPYSYFQAAEQYERANGNAFEEWKIMLPQEFTEQQNLYLVRDLIDTIAGGRLPCTYAFHCPTTMDGQQPQPHIHLLISARQNDGIPRGPEQHFKRYNRDHPERGGAQKDEAFRQRRTTKLWRVTVSDVINVHLERAGLSAWIHPDRLEDRGLDRKPEPRLLPKQSREYREQGKVSQRVQDVLAVREQAKGTRTKEQLNARQYWEHRKAELGIMRDMDLPEQLAAVGTARTQARDPARTHTVAEAYAGVEQDDRLLGDLAGAAVRQAEHEAQAVWGEAQSEIAAQVLGREGRERLQELRAAATGLWAEAMGVQALQDNGHAVATCYEFVLPPTLSPEAQHELATDIEAAFFSQHHHVAQRQAGELHVTVQDPDDAAFNRPTEMRGAMAVLVSSALERAGSDTPVAAHHFTTGSPGWDTKPGDTTEGIERRRIDCTLPTTPQAQSEAREAWQAQKQYLGLRGTERQDVVEACRGRFFERDRSPGRLKEEQAAIERVIRREHAATGRPLQGPRQAPTRDLAHQIAALVAQLDQHSEGEHHGGRLRVRLGLEEEREREHQGMSW